MKIWVMVLKKSILKINYLSKIKNKKIKVIMLKIFHFHLKSTKKLKNQPSNFKKKIDQIKKMYMKVCLKIRLIEELIKMKFSKKFASKK